jgi:type IV pilus assembly protein PilV
MRTSRSRLMAGFALIEALVTIVVVAFGLLGIAGLVSRAFVAEVEATQRTQAAMLLQDMVTRIEANRANGPAYVTGDTGVSTTSTTCNAGAPLAQQDLCQWGRLLGGANERINNQNAGVLVGAVGCIYALDAFNRVYAVAIAWQGMSAGAAPDVTNNFAPNECGRDSFGAANENLRRVMVLPVRLGTLAAI